MYVCVYDKKVEMKLSRGKGRQMEEESVERWEADNRWIQMCSTMCLWVSLYNPVFMHNAYMQSEYISKNIFKTVHKLIEANFSNLIKGIYKNAVDIFKIYYPFSSLPCMLILDGGLSWYSKTIKRSKRHIV